MRLELAVLAKCYVVDNWMYTAQQRSLVLLIDYTEFCVSFEWYEVVKLLIRAKDTSTNSSLKFLSSESGTEKEEYS